MSDLIQTIEEGDDDGAQEADDDALELADKEGGLNFRDLVSGDEDEADEESSAKPKGAGGWAFDDHSAEDAPMKDPAGFLAERIKEKLERRRQAAAEADGEANEGGSAPAQEDAHQDATAGAGEAEEDDEDQANKKVKEEEKKDAKAQQGGSKSSGKKRSAAQEPQGTLGHLRTDLQWADLRLSRPLLRAAAELHFDTPTPIQRDVIPPALAGQDILATAETGSGKTASFLLPILERLCQSPNVRGRKRDASGRMMIGRVATKAMILIPSRELAVQCYSMLQSLAKYTMVTYQLVAGGYAQREQAASLRHQPDIVVATPGRLLDHLLNTQSVHMELLEVVVFDEADRLLELGFRQECMTVLEHCAKGRQTMLFSATLNASVGDLAELALVKPVTVHVNKANRVAETLEQEFVKAPREDLREAVLLSLVTRNYTKRVIVFCATKKATHRVAILLGLHGLAFTEISGNLLQADRVQALQRFQSGAADFLVATDLAARGLDLQNVDIVINFHLPLDTARYIHRVGRTARAGRSGRAVTIYTPEEYMKVKKLGKQCCTQVKAKVFKRSVAAEAIEHCAEKIRSLEGDIEELLQEEGIERESRYANMLMDKSENISKNKESIHSRPAKTWFLSGVDKRKLKQEETTKIQALQAEDLNEEAAAEEPAPPKPAMTEIEKREEKYKLRVREQYMKKVSEAKIEKAKELEMSRRLARPAKAKNRAERMTKEKGGGLYDREKPSGGSRKKGKKPGGGKGGGRGGGSKRSGSSGKAGVKKGRKGKGGRRR